MIDPHSIDIDWHGADHPYGGGEPTDFRVMPDFGFHRGNKSLVRAIGSRSERRIKSQKAKTREVLTKLEKVRGEWVTPRQIRGKGYPHYSLTLRVLAEIGIIEKRRREGTKNRFEYRLPPGSHKSGRITASKKSRS